MAAEKKKGPVLTLLDKISKQKHRYFLMKSEPDAYSIDDLIKDKTTPWDGIRNYQARNIMRDFMRVGDQVLFYHSNAKPPGVIGTAKVCSEAKTDITAFDKKNKYFDPNSKKDEPTWVCVDIEFEAKFSSLVSLDDMKEEKTLEGMLVVQKGARLSIQPLMKAEYNKIVKMGAKKNGSN